jgi:hypothetical protein
VYSVTEVDMESYLKFSECCNPFEEMRHSTQRKNLRSVLPFNDSLQSGGESPVKLKRVGETKYLIAKLAKIEDILKEKIF